MLHNVRIAVFGRTAGIINTFYDPTIPTRVFVGKNGEASIVKFSFYALQQPKNNSLTIAQFGATAPPHSASAPVSPAPDASITAGATLAGTTWEYRDSVKKKGFIEFRADGVLLYRYKSGYYDSAHWEQQGQTVRIGFSYADCVGQLEGNDRLEGTALNRAGKRWTWSARKTGKTIAAAGQNFAGPPTLLGTMWRVSESNGIWDIFEFRAGGVVHYQDITSDDYGQWVQSGSTLKIFFNNRFAEYDGNVDGKNMAGTASNQLGKRWTWTAEEGRFSFPRPSNPLR
jgi:hypothetical protein